MRCPVCGAETSAKAKTCSRCGKSLDSSALAASTPAAGNGQQTPETAEPADALRQPPPASIGSRYLDRAYAFEERGDDQAEAIKLSTISHASSGAAASAVICMYSETDKT